MWLKAEKTAQRKFASRFGSSTFQPLKEIVMKNLISKIAAMAVAVPFVVMGFAGLATAQEEFAPNLILKYTGIKTSSTMVAVPKWPSAVDAFTGTYVYCPPPSPCALEMNVVSELSDVSPATDSLRFIATVDGSAVDVFPTTNLGINSTAKVGQMESGSGTWLRKNLVPGYHHVRIQAAVNDTNGDGFVSGYIGDRSLVIRIYSSQY
jgi:hypothetical protein